MPPTPKKSNKDYFLPFPLFLFILFCVFMIISPGLNARGQGVASSPDTLGGIGATGTGPGSALAMREGTRANNTTTPAANSTAPPPPSMEPQAIALIEAELNFKISEAVAMMHENITIHLFTEATQEFSIFFEGRQVYRKNVSFHDTYLIYVPDRDKTGPIMVYVSNQSGGLDRLIYESPEQIIIRHGKMSPDNFKDPGETITISATDFKTEKRKIAEAVSISIFQAVFMGLVLLFFVLNRHPFITLGGSPPPRETLTYRKDPGAKKPKVKPKQPKDIKLNEGGRT